MGVSPHRRAALGIGRSYQQAKLFSHMTVTENLLVARHCPNANRRSVMRLVLRKHAREEAEQRERAERAIDFFELYRYLFMNLPYGLQKLVGVARTLMLEPRSCYSTSHLVGRARHCRQRFHGARRLTLPLRRAGASIVQVLSIVAMLISAQAGNLGMPIGFAPLVIDHRELPQYVDGAATTHARRPTSERNLPPACAAIGSSAGVRHLPNAKRALRCAITTYLNGGLVKQPIPSGGLSWGYLA